MELTFDYERLVKSLKQDKELVISTIYKESFNYIYRYIYFRVYSEKDAQDVTEEVYIKLMSQINKYKAQESIGSWLYQIARTQIADFWRKNYSVTQKLVEDILVEQDSLEDDLKAEEKVKVILEKLPENYSEVLKLRFLKGYSLEESAKELNTSISNIKVMQHRALKKAQEIQI